MVVSAGDGAARRAEARAGAPARHRVRHAADPSQLALDAPTAAALPRGGRQVRAADRRHPQGGRHGHERAQGAAGGGVSPTRRAWRQLAELIVNDRTKVQALEAQRTAENRRVLSPTQFAKLIVAWPQINRQVEDRDVQGDARRALSFCV